MSVALRCSPRLPSRGLRRAAKPETGTTMSNRLYYAMVSRSFRSSVARSAEAARARYAARWARVARGSTPPDAVLVAGVSARDVAVAVPWQNRAGPGWWVVAPCPDCGGAVDDGRLVRCHPCRVRARRAEEARARANLCRLGKHEYGAGRFLRNEHVPWYAGAHAGMYQIIERTCLHCGRVEERAYPGMRRD